MERRDDIDFVKAVMIILMVVFHLSAFSFLHPFAKEVVYSFHMPIFLIISGYFCQIYDASKMRKRLWWLLVPYVILESSYIFMCFFLPVKEHIECLNLSVWGYHLFIHPLGPYWYLHTLGFCMMLTHLTFYHNLGRSTVANLIIATLILALMDKFILMENAMYFMIGVALSICDKCWNRIMKPTWWALPPILWILYSQSSFHRGSLTGILLTWFAISLCLKVWPTLKLRLQKVFLLIGRNTFSILLFSPIFTLLSKNFLPFFCWDTQKYCYMIVSTIFTLTGSLLITFILDHLRLSPFIFGKKQALYKR